MDAPGVDVEDVLAVGDEDGNQQRRAAAVQVGGPDDFVSVAEFEDGGDEFEQGGFVVGDFLRKQTVSVSVDHDTVMMGFAGIDTGPQFRQNKPPVRRTVEIPADKRAVVSLSGDHVASLDQRSGHCGECGRPILRSRHDVNRPDHSNKAIPASPG
ncbi:hypothetical protein RCH17_003785 [Arthrobacter sp. MP_M7]|nr:hypothetical protein [Arthrobacter sp. MP_M4]MEC5204953.1 hypothetical protein [Arthrobacter sp. MP_M7]